MQKVFIDGQAGTTGLQIYSRLSLRKDIELLEIEHQHRKSLEARQSLINSSDLVILCLPDNAAKQAINLIYSDNVRVLDASSAHRISKGWTYGLPEISQQQINNIKNAQLVSNPGCYPTGAILLLQPLIKGGLLSSQYPYSISAVSGYSGGGRDTIERFEDQTREDFISTQLTRYALHHEHKHIKEIKEYAELSSKPVFTPSYGRYRQGIILQIPIHLSSHKNGLTADDLRSRLSEHYSSSQFVNVLDKEQTESLNAVDPEFHNNTNLISLMVFSPDGTDHAVLCAIFDNLGKGASGVAVQNLEIMLGLSVSDGKVTSQI